MKKMIVLLLVCLMVFSCSSKKVIKTEQAPPQEDRGAVNESFDPLVLKDDDLDVKKRTNSEVKSDVDDSNTMNVEEAEIVEKEVIGYRVQLCAVPNEENAREIQKEVILKMSESVYLIYDSPYYKIRIGDCLTRFDADKLQTLAVSKGFAEAWVVKTKVKILPKPKEEELNSDQPQ